MIKKNMKIFTALLSFSLVFSFFSPVLAEASCTDYYYGVDGFATANVQTTKYTNSNERSIAWGLVIDKEDQKKMGSEIRVSPLVSRVNGDLINDPYQTHYAAPDYNFHGSLKKYQYRGKSGGGTLKKGDSIILEFGIITTDPGNNYSDKVRIACTLD